jgi:RecJ-like exonuclease
MDATTAKKALNRPLTFGDRDQIAAIAFEQQVAEAVERAMADPHEDVQITCRLCDGEGRTECCECGHMRDCEECDGEGHYTGPPRPQDLPCMNDYSEDVVEESARRLRDARPFYWR